jgi:AraC-like DNA-binding protein
MQALFEKIQAPGQSFLVKERSDARFDFRWHYHPELELTWIVESAGMRFVGDGLARYGSGDLILLGANLPHTWQSDEGSKLRRHRAVYAQFREDFLGGEILELPEMASVQKLFERAALGVRFTGKTVSEASARLEKLIAAGGVQRVARMLDLLGVLATARHTVALSSRAFSPTLRRGDQSRIDAVCRHINEHFTERLTQPDAARVAHLSVPAFSRFFKRSLGRTFTDYVNELRIGSACRALIETDKSVAEICYASGFENLSNFNRRFLALKKMSPREFRRRYEVKN